MNLENLTTKIEQFYFTFRHGDFANKVAGYTITINNEKVADVLRIKGESARTTLARARKVRKAILEHIELCQKLEELKKKKK